MKNWTLSKLSKILLYILLLLFILFNSCSYINTSPGLCYFLQTRLSVTFQLSDLTKYCLPIRPSTSGTVVLSPLPLAKRVSRGRFLGKLSTYRSIRYTIALLTYALWFEFICHKLVVTPISYFFCHNNDCLGIRALFSNFRFLFPRWTFCVSSGRLTPRQVLEISVPYSRFMAESSELVSKLQRW